MPQEIARSPYSVLYRDGDDWVVKTGDKIKRRPYKDAIHLDSSCVEKYGYVRVAYCDDDPWKPDDEEDEPDEKLEKAALAVASLAVMKAMGLFGVEKAFAQGHISEWADGSRHQKTGPTADDWIDLPPREGSAADIHEKSEAAKTKSKRSKSEALPKSANEFMPFLTPSEQEGMTARTAKSMYDTFSNMPLEEETAAVAISGAAKKGWYRESTKAINHIFGADAPRFVGLLASLSPQCSVQTNTTNALTTWKNWIAADRPTDEVGLKAVLLKSLGKASAEKMKSWTNNATRALTIDNPNELKLSGPKVNSFKENLWGNMMESTNDTWMAHYGEVKQALFSGSTNESGKGPGYKAFSAHIRAAAEKATEMTGEEWTPAEIQECVWSWTKHLVEMREVKGKEKDNRDINSILDSGDVKHEDINDVVDFGKLFSQGLYAQLLGEAGYKEKVDELSKVETGNAGTRGGNASRSVAQVPETVKIDQDAFRGYLKKRADALERYAKGQIDRKKGGEEVDLHGDEEEEEVPTGDIKKAALMLASLAVMKVMNVFGVEKRDED